MVGIGVRLRSVRPAVANITSITNASFICCIDIDMSTTDKSIFLISITGMLEDAQIEFLVLLHASRIVGGSVNL